MSKIVIVITVLSMPIWFAWLCWQQGEEVGKMARWKKLNM